MPAFDPATARRLITNNRIRTAQGWGTYRDLQGALALTSDAPIAALNCISDFDTTGDELDGILDIGFALLRVFDCPPAVEVTPLDRPPDIAASLERRGLQLSECRSWMTYTGDPASIAINRDLRVRVADGDDVLTFGNLHGGSERWVRRLSKASMFEAMLHPGNTFYLGLIEGQPVATLHLLIDHAASPTPAPPAPTSNVQHPTSRPTTPNDQRPTPTAGIYAVGTMRAHRNRGIASTMIARAIHDARAAGCDLIGLSTDAVGPAERLYNRLGFTTAFESQLWVEPDHPVEPIKIRRRRTRRSENKRHTTGTKR